MVFAKSVFQEKLPRHDFIRKHRRRDTYRLFDLVTGVPTDAYGFDEAVSDGFLVPPQAVSLTTGFLERGIRYELSDEEKEAQLSTFGLVISLA